MMYVPPQQALVIDRMHSGARRFVVLDFEAPILLTDMVILILSCNDLVSLSIDIWLHREETDGQRLIVASDIGMRSLVICDLQPPPVCRYIKITTIGRYGMGTKKFRIPVGIGMFYGHTVVLPTDLGRTLNNLPMGVTVLSPTNIQPHLAVLANLVEDISCPYQMCRLIKSTSVFWKMVSVSCLLALMLRVCGFQPWWVKFLATTFKSLISSSNNSVFPQDRVFILMVYLSRTFNSNSSSSWIPSFQNRHDPSRLGCDASLFMLGWCELHPSFKWWQ